LKCGLDSDLAGLTTDLSTVQAQVGALTADVDPL
jgi:hypothetical protein